MQFTFAATNDVSPTWYGMRGGFNVGLTVAGGSYTIQNEIEGNWYDVGAAITATGRRSLSAGVDYSAPSRFRVKCGTFLTSGSMDLSGDILATEVTSFEAKSLTMETDQDWLLETGEDLLLEVA